MLVVSVVTCPPLDRSSSIRLRNLSISAAANHGSLVAPRSEAARTLNQSLQATCRVEYSVPSTSQLIARTAPVLNRLESTGTTLVLLYRHASHAPTLAPIRP